MDEAGAFLAGFLGLMVLMFIVWLYTGGPARFEHDNPGAFLTSPAPLGTGESFDNLNSSPITISGTSTQQY